MIWELLAGAVDAMTTTEMREDLEISDEQVSVRAYEIWEQRGEHGQDIQDWLTAEEQLIETAIEKDVVEEDINVEDVLNILDKLPKESN